MRSYNVIYDNYMGSLKMFAQCLLYRALTMTFVLIFYQRQYLKKCFPVFLLTIYIIPELLS